LLFCNLVKNYKRKALKTKTSIYMFT